MLFRKSTQSVQRPYHQADGQLFRMSRARAVQGGRGMAYLRDPAYWREATCQEVECSHRQRGWQTTLDLSPVQDPGELGLNRARYNYIREKSGRHFTEQWVGAEVTFMFPAGQTCFRQHQLPVERDPVFIHVPGPGRDPQRLDYDQFFWTFNEVSHLLEKRRKQG